MTPLFSQALATFPVTLLTASFVVATHQAGDPAPIYPLETEEADAPLIMTMMTPVMTPVLTISERSCPRGISRLW